MHTSELLKHIYDINLSYLLLAQRLIVQDKASAMFRLGINEEMATTLAALTLPQMVKLAETNQLVCHFRFDSHQTITQLTQDSRVDDLQQISSCNCCGGNFITHAHQPVGSFACSLCQPPSRAVKRRKLSQNPADIIPQLLDEQRVQAV
ncbi:TPA: flagellar transcriptional regulator FlhD [Escherichia coli]